MIIFLTLLFLCFVDGSFSTVVTNSLKARSEQKPGFLMTVFRKKKLFDVLINIQNFSITRVQIEKQKECQNKE